MEKTQREYYLNEQMKAIQKELGDEKAATNWPSSKTRRQTGLQGGPREGDARAQEAAADVPMSAEATVAQLSRLALSILWNKKTWVKKDLKAAQTTSITITSAGRR
jgi:ATP-dependent Lon protease